jgi:hypothetical protein
LEFIPIVQVCVIFLKKDMSPQGPSGMKEEKNRNEKTFVSHHILPTAANLLGLCFVILSFMKVTKLGLESIIDEMMAAAVVIFLVACLFSYASIRSLDKAEPYEKIADGIFVLGLVLLTITALIIVFQLI